MLVLTCGSVGPGWMRQVTLPDLGAPIRGNAVVVDIGDGLRIDEMYADVLARYLVTARSISVRGTNPAGVSNVRAAIDAAMNIAADEAALETWARTDLTGPGGRDAA